MSQVQQLRAALLKKPVATRTRADYENILALLPPLWADSTDPAASSARFEAASLYVAMARDLHDSSAYGQAATILRELLQVSPYTSYRRNADFCLAQIGLYHLRDQSGARAWLRDFIRRYPADPRVQVARQELHGIRLSEPEYMMAEDPLPSLPSSAPPRPILAPATSAVAPPPAAGAAEATSRARQWTVNIGNIEGVQVFTRAASTSVVLALRHRVTFSRGVLPRRHLVYFDVSSQGASEQASSGSARLRVGDGRVLSIHIAQFRRDETRVVIQMTRGVQADRGGLYPNPERLIVGLTGAHAAVAAAPPRAAQPLADGRDSLTRALGLKIKRIVLDPGHGGFDTGTIGPGNLYEKNVVLDVALKLGKLLQRRMGLAVTYTRTTDVFVPLQERTAIANRAQADVFISIHANSSPYPRTRGIETYYLNFTRDPQALAVAARENAGSSDGVHDLPVLLRSIALNNKLEESQELADDVQHSLVQATGEANRGVKTAPFVVLIGAHMPSILAEITFLSNRTDDRSLRTAAYRQRIAEGLYQGIRRYILSLSGTSAVATAQDPPR
ncbi:MAG: N-acetylmuramoyl-L-alanine amidase [Terriglobales bacterium]